MDCLESTPTPLAATKALYNDEILRTIISHLHGSRRADLARCARLNCAFSEPALDGLWGCVDDLHHLLRVLDAQETEEAGFTLYALNKYENIPSASWDRLEFYSRRIRELRLRSIVHRMHPSVWEALTQHAEQRPLFRGLTSLAWTAYGDLSPAELRFVSCITAQAECIRNLQLCVDKSPYLDDPKREQVEEVATLIESWTRGLPYLEHLTFHAIHHTSPLDFLGGCAALKDIDLGPVGGADLVSRCASLPLLSSLTVRFDCDDSNDTVQLDDPATHGFNALRALDIGQGTGEDVITLCQSVSSKHLETLKMTGLAVDMRTFPISLSGVLPTFAASLRTVRVSCMATGMNGDIIPFHGFIAPFLHLHQLEDFNLIVLRARELQFTDDDVLAMAQAWPQLGSLSLMFKCLESETPSRASLVYFGRHCPDLRRLHLSCGVFRNNLSPGPAPRDPEVLPAHPLERLELWWGNDLEDIRVFARFLLSNYPSLRLSHAYRGADACLRQVLQAVEAEMGV